jgi:hypothetical protein
MRRDNGLKGVFSPVTPVLQEKQSFKVTLYFNYR